MYLIKVVPIEQPMKLAFSIFKKFKTSKILLVTSWKLFFKLLNFKLSLPWEGKSIQTKSYFSFKGLICLNHILEFPPNPCKKTIIGLLKLIFFVLWIYFII